MASNNTIDLSKVNLTVGAPPFKLDGNFASGEFITVEFTTPTTAMLEGVNGQALVLSPNKLTRRGVRIAVNLLESAPSNKALAALYASGRALPLIYFDGDTKIVGTCQLENLPPLAKSTAGTTRGWLILGANCVVTYGAAATAEDAGA